MAIIELVDVEKKFTVRKREGRWRRNRLTVHAVNGICCSVEPGELVGYIGPNGAGKSTTVKILTGILTASSGRVAVTGLDPSRHRITLARRVGVVFGQRTTLWWDLPLRDSFELLRHLHRIPESRYRTNLDRFIDLLELGSFLDIPVRQLSLGQRMRGDLTAALLHDPQVVYLDEPTIGLDLFSKTAVRRFLAETNREEGTTIMMTTHDLDDIERLCRRILVIDHGSLAFDGGLDDLRAKANVERTLIVDLAHEGPAIEVSGPATPARVIRVEGRRQWLAFPSTTSAAPLIAAITAQYEVSDLSVREPDIDDVVSELYRSSRPAAPAVVEVD